MEVGDIECPILVNIAVLFGMPVLDFPILGISRRQQMDLAERAKATLPGNEPVNQVLVRITGIPLEGIPIARPIAGWRRLLKVPRQQ